MRPVERGPAPRPYAAYDDAIGDLVERLGRYCSYCERRLPVSLAVEHMAPKSFHDDREIDWSNFLLGCANCNSVKGDKDVADEDVLWPDRHNTMLAFAYVPGGFVEVGGALDEDLRRRADGLIELVGLDRHGARGWPRPTDKDGRWAQREETWALAERCRSRFESLVGSAEALDFVLDVARGYGFFSVWMAVFDRHPDARRALVEAFPGTARSCFNAEGDPVSRPGSVI